MRMSKLFAPVRRTGTLAAVAAAAAIIGLPAIAQQRETDWDWTGGRPGQADTRLIGSGVRLLSPELRNTQRGRAFVLRNFDDNGDAAIDRAEARAANAAFARLAGTGRGRFDWDSRDGAGRPGPGPVAGGGAWNADAMRSYRFRQTSRGATMNLDDAVLFATGSATLRAGAIDKLTALADYLRAERNVRVAIEGHTDSVGAAVNNQLLSERRADAVRMAFDQLGVTRARFTVKGFGEEDPIASNVTAAGRAQNRRVEITLLGLRAERFR